MTKLKKYLLILASCLILFLGSAYCWLQINHYPASKNALALTEQHALHQTKETYYFAAEVEHARSTTVVLYGGALVDIEAYSPLATALAQAGYDVYLLNSPFDIAFLDHSNWTDIVPKDQPIILMGHSLGGVMAAKQAAELQNQSQVKLSGLVLLAAYPSQTTDLSQSSIKVLSLWGSQDQVLNKSHFDAAQVRLPATSHYVEIAGGNHAQFADYGSQKGDGIATITQAAQIQVVLEEMALLFNP